MPKLKIMIVALIIIFSVLLFAKTSWATEAICLGGSNPDPNVIWCDDFETGTWMVNWTAQDWCCDRNGDGDVWDPGERNAVACGSSGYQDNCAAWNINPNLNEHWVFDGEWGWDCQNAYKENWNVLPAEYYVRWYIYVSPGFSFGNTGDKNLRFRNFTGGTQKMSNTISLSHADCGNGKPCFHRVYPVGEVAFKQNQGHDITLQGGKWYLFEAYYKMNTVGQSDGVFKLWVDEAVASGQQQTLRTHHTNVVYRTENVLPNYIELTAYHQRNAPKDTQYGDAYTQYFRWDNIVISKAPIGPLGGTTPDTTPPAAPSGVTII